MMNFQELCSPLPQVARANFNEDPYVQDFGIAIDQKMVTVTGRILPPPLLQYGGEGGKAGTASSNGCERYHKKS